MSLWYAVWRVALYNVKAMIASQAVSQLGMYLPLLSAVVLREFFNALSGQAPARFDAMTIVGLFLAVNVVLHISRVGATTLSQRFDQAYRQALLQRNLFRSILDSPPLYGGPSTGDAINRFRDDTEAITRFAIRALSVVTFALSIIAAA